jgi:hypothetical protein
MSPSEKPLVVSRRRRLSLSSCASILGVAVSLTVAGRAHGIGGLIDGLLPIDTVLERPIDDLPPFPPIDDPPILDPGDGTIDADTYFWLSASQARGNMDLHVFLASRLRTDTSFGDGETVASIQFTLPPYMTRGNARVASILVIADELPILEREIPLGGLIMENLISKIVRYQAWIDLDSNGTPDRPAADLGVLSSVRFATYLTSPSPHLIVELTVPVAFPSLRREVLEIPPTEEPPGLYPVTPSFIVGYLLNDGSRPVRVGSALTHVADEALVWRFQPPVDRVVPASLVHGSLGSLNLPSAGTAHAAILSTPSLSAAVLNPFLFRWFDPIDPAEEASPISAEARDVDEDGLVDMVLAFDVEDLMTRGIVDETTGYAAFRSLEDRRVGATAPVRVSTEPLFRRGDSNSDGDVNLSDATHILGFLFAGSDAPLCADAADTNDDAQVNITDALSILGWLFLGNVEPAAPGPETCGFDVNADALPECSPQVCSAG